MISLVVFTILLLFLSPNRIPSVHASLYPTRPTSTTSYTAGHNASIAWTDSSSPPHLSEINGTMKIELYAGDNVFLSVLKDGLDPLEMGCEVYIPGKLGTGYSNYTMRFITTQPPQTIYTSYFTIANASTPNRTTAATSTIQTQTAMQPLVLTITIPPSNPSTFVDPATYIDAASPSQSIPDSLSQQSVTTFYPPAYTTYPGSNNQITSSAFSSNGKLGPRGWDFEKLKFRVVFILWPALIGITMAL
ncbi:hypothetical protein JAAARDRAFT_197072 [Jaapia argillacea MUCL 33604]|uniref:Uncharacterized protein n=1 Tax=Jaapia argillacea MUCL 33604 TaxID=933084 RepID=A0A067PRP6_9AGAM|nr:hypothetical protein JAAARDRAFT_197072 [Jaapia argillacea MUCL 33604]